MPWRSAAANHNASRAERVQDTPSVTSRKPRELLLLLLHFDGCVSAPLPAQAHAKGAWTEEEHQTFLETARAHGAGNKWGLFASHLRNRVGYDCSAYYRSVMIPSVSPQEDAPHLHGPLPPPVDALPAAMATGASSATSQAQMGVHSSCCNFCPPPPPPPPPPLAPRAQGLILDPSFKMTASGKAVYVGLP